MNVDILGEKYTVETHTEYDDEKLIGRNGYCDNISKTIVVDNLSEYADAEKTHVRNHVLRHECIHAFLNESGLQEQCEWVTEECVDFFSIQYPKMKRIFEKLGIEE